MNSEEWYDSIPKDIRPKRNQPFYHLFAENDDGPLHCLCFTAKPTA